MADSADSATHSKCPEILYFYTKEKMIKYFQISIF